jgi:NAD+ synthase
MSTTTDYAIIEKKITSWLHQYLRESGCSGFVVGLSGGLDSSVTAVLCRKVTKATLGLIMPCGHTPSDAASDAKKVAMQFKIEYRSYDLTPAYNSFLSILQLPSGTPVTIPLANVKARLRMITLYYEANRLHRLIAGTGNRTEIMLGFFTKYGDGGVDILPLGNLLKRDIRGLANHLGIPKHIIAKIPSPGLWAGQTDEGELGASYEQLDDLISGIPPPGLTQEEIQNFQKRIAANEHKRNSPPICPL